MADAVAVRTISESNSWLVLHLTNYSDATGESAVIKVDKSTLTTKNAAGASIEPVSLDVAAFRWNVQGFSSVRLRWNHTTMQDIAVVSGSGQDTFSFNSGAPQFNAPYGLQDPRTTGGTGDIELTTTGAAAGNSYDITLYVYKRST